jgi:hypothetical protein
MRTCGRSREPSRRVRDASVGSYRAPARGRATQSAHRSVNGPLEVSGLTRRWAVNSFARTSPG